MFSHKRLASVMTRLRYGFLPSDFHPMVLVLGETEGLRRFGALLRSFADEPRPVNFASLDFMCAADETRIVLTGTGAEPGMRLVSPRERKLVWTLQPWQAEMFSGMVLELAAPGRRSGSEFLEAAVGEIRMKVSLGEYTDDFLVKA